MRRGDDAWRELEGQGYRVIRFEKDDRVTRTAKNEPELYAPIVSHNLKRSGLDKSLERFEKALALRRSGRTNEEIRQVLGFDSTQ